MASEWPVPGSRKATPWPHWPKGCCRGPCVGCDHLDRWPDGTACWAVTLLRTLDWGGGSPAAHGAALDGTSRDWLSPTTNGLVVGLGLDPCRIGESECLLGAGALRGGTGPRASRTRA